MQNKLRIGITMRGTNAVGYHELRDSIDVEWASFMKIEMPGVQWLYLPNIGEDILSFVRDWGVNAIILTGGENIGENETRDKTETELLKYATENRVPVLGVCRGLQMIYHFFGGKILTDVEDVFAQKHVAKSHTVLFNSEKIQVNSYHKNRLDQNSIPKKLVIEGICEEDGTIEAVSGTNVLGLMWHPERELAKNKRNGEIIRNFFKI